MKSFILVCFFLLSCFLVANSQTNFTRLNRTTVRGSQLIQDLRQLGANYVLEQGIFHSNKTALPNGSWDIERTLSVEARENGTRIYYRYAVILRCASHPFTIRARYIVSFNRSNFNTLVTWWIYTNITGEGSGGGISDLPQFVDTALLKDESSGLQDYLDEGFNYTVTDAVANGQLPKGNYRVARVFSIQHAGFIFPPAYTFLVKLANDSNRKYYRALITVVITDEIPEEDQGNYPPEYVLYPNK